MPCDVSPGGGSGGGGGASRGKWVRPSSRRGGALGAEGLGGVPGSARPLDSLARDPAKSTARLHFLGPGSPLTHPPAPEGVTGRPSRWQRISAPRPGGGRLSHHSGGLSSSGSNVMLDMLE